MKIKITISREYDTESDDHAHLFEGIKNPEKLAMSFFSEDLAMISAEDLERQAKVEIDK